MAARDGTWERLIRKKGVIWRVWGSRSRRLITAADDDCGDDIQSEGTTDVEKPKPSSRNDDRAGILQGVCRLMVWRWRRRRAIRARDGCCTPRPDPDPSRIDGA